jgi:hypothetical protein
VPNVLADAGAHLIIDNQRESCGFCTLLVLLTNQYPRERQALRPAGLTSASLLISHEARAILLSFHLLRRN